MKKGRLGSASTPRTCHPEQNGWISIICEIIVRNYGVNSGDDRGVGVFVADGLGIDVGTAVGRRTR